MFLQPSTSRGSKTFLQMFCKYFILHVTTFKNVLAAVKNLAKHFSGLVHACCQIFMSQRHYSQSQCFLGSREKDVVLRRDAI